MAETENLKEMSVVWLLCGFRGEEVTRALPCFLQNPIHHPVRVRSDLTAECLPTPPKHAVYSTEALRHPSVGTKVSPKNPRTKL